MQTVFFPVDPSDDDENPFDQVQERMPSFEPPRDELPALFAASEIVGRAEDVVIALLGARVFSDGVELLVDRHLRRGNRDERAWQLAQMDFAGHWGQSSRGPERLRWGLVLGNGERLFLDDRFGGGFESEQEGHTVRMSGGGGSGTGDGYTMHDGLWLWPLPPDGPLELVVQWPAFGLVESRVILDGGRLRALGAEARKLWV